MTWKKKYILLPQDASPELAVAATLAAFPTRTTVGFSADDARLMSPDVSECLVVAVNPGQWLGDVISYIRKTGANVATVEAQYPGELAIKLLQPATEVYLSQKDKTWSKTRLGHGTETIGVAGCFLVSFAMMLRRLFGHDITPDWLNSYLKFVPGAFSGSYLSWVDATKPFGLTSVRRDALHTTHDLQVLLNAGWQVILKTKAGNNDHFVLLDRIEGKPVVYDPLTGHREWTEKILGIRAAKPITQSQQPAPPPPPPSPVHVPAPTRPRVSLHMQTEVPGWVEFLQRVRPPVVKVFTPELARIARENVPETIILYRKYHGNQEQFLSANKINVGGWIDYLRPDIEELRRIGGPVAVESLNEMAGSGPELEALVEFDRQFCYAVRELGVFPAILTLPVGNPLPEQVSLLVPAVRAAVETDGFLAPHAYATFVDTVHGLNPHTDLRPFALWDPVFVSKRLFPRYIVGEAGLVKALSPTGPFDPYGGWRLLGWEQTIRYITSYDRYLRTWGNGRCFGFCLFTSGIGTGWEQFQFGPDEFRKISESIL